MYILLFYALLIKRVHSVLIYTDRCYEFNDLLYKREKCMYGRKPELCEGIKEQLFMGATPFKGKR